MPVNFDTFVRVANLKGTGELTVRDGGRSLRNEGTLGSRVLSFFRGFAEAYGFVKFGPTQAQRQQAAHEAFGKALKARYGKELADFASKSIDTSQALTGERALAAIQQTTRVGQRELTGIDKLSTRLGQLNPKDFNEHVNVAISNERAKLGVMPAESDNSYYAFKAPWKDSDDKLGGLTFSDDSALYRKTIENRPDGAINIQSRFDDLAEMAGVDRSLFRGNVFQGFNKMTELYRNKMEDAVHAESNGGRDLVSSERMNELATETLKSMRGLKNDVDAEKVLNARFRLTDLTRDFIDLVMNNKSDGHNPARADKLGQALIEIDNQMKDMLTTMGREGTVSDEIEALLSASSYAVRGNPASYAERENPASKNLAEQIGKDPDLAALKAGGGAVKGSDLKSLSTQLEAALLGALAIGEQR